MSWIETLLTRIEAHLRTLVEGDATGDGFPKKLHKQLARELRRAMKAEAVHTTIETILPIRRLVPDQYTLVLPAIEAQILLTHSSELDRLTRGLESQAARENLVFDSPPMLRVVADPQTVKTNIQTSFSQPGEDDSHTYQLQGAPGPSRHEGGHKLPNAFLIVNGIKTYPLTEPIVNIGRTASNQLWLDDPHLSPQHAQLRFVQGQFVIFDLDSRGGTFVNGVAVSRHILKPGDVIELAGIPLVYGQETSVPATQTQELPANPPPPEVL